MAKINAAAGSGAHPAVQQGLNESDFADLTAQNKRYEELAGNYDNYQKAMTMAAEKSSLERYRIEMNAAKKGTQARKLAEAAYNREKQRVEKKALDIALAMTQNSYKRATVLEKAEIKKRQADAIAATRQRLKKQRDLDLNAAAGDKKKQDEINKKYKEQTLATIQQEQKAREEANKITRSEQFADLKAVRDKMKSFKEDAANGDFSIVGSIMKLTQNGLDVALGDMAKDAKAREEASKAELQSLQGELAEMQEAGIDPSSPEYIEQQRKIAEMQSQVLQEGWERAGADFAAQFADKVKATYNKVEEMAQDYKGIIEGRLQGSGKSYEDVMGTISGNLAMSPFVKTKDVIDNMKRMAEEGYAYNIEQRAFLSSISEKIAKTFDAFDSNLTRLIKLQQADTTAARLGMEASLTKFFNNMFQDSSYLKNVADSISGAIIDANATLNRDASAEFEYIVQKWLGSLSSVGMDQGTLTQIAQGINYIATGDVTSLANNNSLQTLFAMSASNAGLSYSDLLLNGLNASNTNRLLEAMVTYLKDIAENSDNQVVRAAYGDIFSLSMSDMKAISNLSKADITNIAGNTLSYSGMMTETNKQLLAQFTRNTIAGMTSTLYENAIFGVAEDMMSNPATYAMFKMVEFMESKDLDINIPFVNAMGFGLDLNTGVRGLLNMGLGIAQAMSLAGNILSGLGSGGGLALGAWGGEEYTKRGSGMTFSTAGAAGDVSGATYVSSGNSTDMKRSAISSATDDAEETGKITNKNNPDVYTVDDLYKAVIEGHEPYVQVQDASILSAFDPQTNTIRTTSLQTEARMVNVENYVSRIKDILEAVQKQDALKIISDAILNVKMTNMPEVKVSTTSIEAALRNAGLSSSSKTDKSLYDMMSGIYNDGQGVRVNSLEPIKIELNKLGPDASNALVNFI